MVIYRPIRGELLDECMKHAKCFNTVKEMLEYIEKESHGAYTINDIYINYEGYDERIDWDTFYVCTGRYGKEDWLEKYGCPQCIGHCTFKE